MMDRALPPRLHAGATIGVAAISSPPNPDRLDSGIERLRSLGYTVVESRNLRQKDGLFAGSVAERAGGYRALLTDSSVDAILFARGGYGASRILDLLDRAEAERHPKIHLGGSDLTALFAWLAAGGLSAFYGPMVAVEIAQEDGLDWQTVLSGGPIAEHSFGPEDVLCPGGGEGPLVGGCLSLIASLCGTPEAVRVAGAVLFLEDIGERIGRIERMLTQLERSGTFDRLTAMIFGSLVSRDGTEPAPEVQSYLRARFAGARFPIATGFPGGHLRRPRTLPLGASARLELDGVARLSFPRPVVR